MRTEFAKPESVGATILPMAEFTMPFLTRVVGVIDDRTGEARGTGVFCMIRGREAVVTAAHVLREAAATGRFRSLCFTRGSGEPPRIVAGRIVYADRWDLAVYLPDESFPIGAEKRFWPEARIDRGPAAWPRDYLFVHGFPGRFHRLDTREDQLVTAESLASGAWMCDRETDVPADERGAVARESPDSGFRPDNFLQPHQLALNFATDPASGLGSDDDPEPRPRGAASMSGSPVWRIGAAGRSIQDWSPEWSELVGIVTDWNAERRALIATSAARIFDVVAPPPEEDES